MTERSAQPLDGDPPRGSSSPAPPASPARSRPSSSGATRSLELVAATSRSDAGTRLDQLYPRYRVPLELTELDLDAARGRRRRDRRLPARRLGAGRRRAARARRPRRRPLRRLPAARPAHLRALVRRARRARAARGRGLRADRALPRRSCARRSWSQPRLLPDRERAGAGAAGRSAACSTTSSIDAKSGVSGAGRGGGDAMHYVVDGRERLPLQDRGPPPPARDRAGAGGARAAPAPVTFVPHLLPLDQGELVSCYAQLDASRSPRTRLQALYRERYADEPFVELVDGAARAARRPRHQPVPHLRHGRGARPGARLRGDRQPLEGRLGPGASRTST